MRRPHYWLRRLGVLVVVLGIGGYCTGAFAAEMRRARTETSYVGGVALATRVERIRLGTVIETTQAELERTWDERTLRHAERVALDRRLQALYAQLLGVNNELSELVASSALHVLSLDATKQCLFGVQRAVEQAAVDDHLGSLASLESVRSACDRARAAGQAS